MDEEAAASRIQSIKRGQQSRAQVTQMKQEENAAATKMAAAKRGKDARDQVKRSRQEAAERALAEEAAKEQAASATLGAGAKGYMARKKVAKQKAEETKATARIQANFRGNKERAAGESTVRKERAAKDPGYQAEQYLKQHKLLELFELLSQQLVNERPEKPKAFLVDALEKLKEKRVPSSPLHFFSEEDVATLYAMYDVSGLGLTPAQCAEALTAMGLELVVKVPAGTERFDLNGFLDLLPVGV